MGEKPIEIPVKVDSLLKTLEILIKYDTFVEILRAIKKGEIKLSIQTFYKVKESLERAGILTNDAKKQDGKFITAFKIHAGEYPIKTLDFEGIMYIRRVDSKLVEFGIKKRLKK